MREYPYTTMEVEPFDEFKEEDWIEPEEFRQMAKIEQLGTQF